MTYSRGHLLWGSLILVCPDKRSISDGCRSISYTSPHPRRVGLRTLNLLHFSTSSSRGSTDSQSFHEESLLEPTLVRAHACAAYGALASVWGRKLMILARLAISMLRLPRNNYAFGERRKSTWKRKVGRPWKYIFDDEFWILKIDTFFLL